MGPSARLHVAGANLRIDVVTVEAARALSDAAIRCVLLKGPTFRDWLYPDGSRTYCDTDLLIAPDRVDEAGDVLKGLGFEDDGSEALAHDRPWYARVWYRSRDVVRIELHRTLVGIGAPPEQAWRILCGHTEKMQLRGSEIEILDEPARAVHVALHAADHCAGRPMEDLSRALDRLPLAVWRDAASVARRLDATAAFGAGIRLLPAGGHLADELGLPENDSVEVALRVMGARPSALALERLATIRGPRSKVAFVIEKTIPPAAYMRSWSRLARRGRAGLLLAYLWRPVHVVKEAVSSAGSWWRIRRDVRRGIVP
jgi:hypothetical protein